MTTNRSPSAELCKHEELPYYAQVIENLSNGEGYWNSLKIGVFRTEDNEKVGEYIRNYSHMFRTFYPFEGKDGNWYALYSPHYTATRIMSLPDCKDLGGEEPAGFGFCPRDYYVPRLLGRDFPLSDPEPHPSHDLPQEERMRIYYQWTAKYPLKSFSPPWGFISGMIWGDSKDDVQWLDLSLAADGKLTRTQRFGCHELPDRVELYEAITIHEPDWTSISDPEFYEKTRIFIAGDVPYRFDGKRREGS